MIRLDPQDLDLLLGKTRPFVIGHTTLIISALGIADFARAAGIFFAMLGGFKELSGAGLKAALPMLLAETPEQVMPLLELLSGIHREDLRQLPPILAADLLLTCIEVNLESMGDLEKKSGELAERIARLAATSDPGLHASSSS